MRRSRTVQRIILIAAAALLLFMLSLLIAYRSAYRVGLENEQLSEVDTYKMHEYSEINSKAVMKALASGSASGVESLMTTQDRAEALVEFADWSSADFDNAVSMGSGSLVTEPDENGNMEICERFFVDAGDKRYVLFVETATSRWGRTNDGVSAVAATTFSHFDAMDYDWNGEADQYSVLVGTLLWNSD